jgi:hypothetical protein
MASSNTSSLGMPGSASQPASSASTLVTGSGGSGYEGLPRIVSVDSSTGCSLTKANIKGLTPSEFEALANKETDLARVIASSAEAKMLGVEERGLATLLTSSVQNIKPLINKQNIAEQSIILPYIQRRQRSQLNANYFAIEAGGVVTNAVGGHTAVADATYTFQGGDWAVVVNLGGSDWAAPLQDIARYFLPGGNVVINHWDAAGNANESQYKIIGSAPADEVGAGGTTIAKAIVSLRPVGGQVDHTPGTGWGNTGAAIQATYEATSGVLQTIANNVADYEAWCRNQPSDLSVRLLVNWLQTTRESREVNQEYKDTLAKIMSGKVNPYLSSMVYQPLNEQNRQAAKLSQDQWQRAVWYNQSISSKQTPETYMQLPTVSDPEDADCTLEYKSNALGIKSLLYEGGRVMDMDGAAINLESLMGHLYQLKRNREQDGDTISVIDAMTDRFTYNRFFTAFNEYYKNRYGWEVHRNAQLNQTIHHDGIILFNYAIYDLPEVGCQLAIFHDPFFDDLLNVGSGDKWNLDGSRATQDPVFDTAGAANFANINRTLWMVDWSDVKIGIAGTKSVTRSQPHPDIAEAYKCRMDSVKREYQLRSTKWTTLLDRPARHLIIQNFSEAIKSDFHDPSGGTLVDPTP